MQRKDILKAWWQFASTIVVFTVMLSQAEAVHWTCLEFSREVSVAQTKGLMYLLLITKFFWDIYQDADEDTRRAIQKSFVEGSAPRGMEMKKWEYRVSSLFQIWTAFLPPSGLKLSPSNASFGSLSDALRSAARSRSLVFFISFSDRTLRVTKRTQAIATFDTPGHPCSNGHLS
ncbi:hypothetical protein V6N11_044687 [Hibiscus sabdariffa]|uniref:SGS domain-containing protein n=1 Tax=Hibiscus sabdariffa TaxID=183260 RepID=A0ABR1ZKW3_9ROSI